MFIICFLMVLLGLMFLFIGSIFLVTTTKYGPILKFKWNSIFTKDYKKNDRQKSEEEAIKQGFLCYAIGLGLIILPAIILFFIDYFIV